MGDAVVLVVEDDPVVRMLMQKQLKILGYTSEAVGTGEEALARANAEIALVFMDIGLPSIDGTMAARLIREKEQQEHRKRVPIIAMTAHSDKDACFLAGMDDFLQKPARLKDIQRVLEIWGPKQNGCSS